MYENYYNFVLIIKCATYPLLTLKTIKQVTPSRSIKGIVMERGLSGLYGGIVLSALRLGPSVAVAYIAKEMATRVLIWHNGYTVDPFRKVPKRDINQKMTPNELKAFLKDIDKKLDK
jgi:hypothetical protein